MNLCTCNPPSNVHNGVCGSCLYPLNDSSRTEDGRLLDQSRPEHWTIGVVENKTGEIELDPVFRKIISDIGYDIENAIDQEILGVFDVPMS